MALAKMIMFALAAASIISMASAISGTATYYSPLHRALFNNRAACGQRYTIRCTGATNQGVPQPCRNGPITVTIVDLCPGCATNQIDLSAQAFDIIADPNAGKIRIEYSRI